MIIKQSKREKNLPYLKNSFFSSSVFRVRLFRKFITSRKSFLIERKMHRVFAT